MGCDKNQREDIETIETIEIEEVVCSPTRDPAIPHGAALELKQSQGQGHKAKAQVTEATCTGALRQLEMPTQWKGSQVCAAYFAQPSSLQVTRASRTTTIAGLGAIVPFHRP